MMSFISVCFVSASITVCLHQALPFIGFGFLDNFLMIVAVRTLTISAVTKAFTLWMCFASVIICCHFFLKIKKCSYI